MASLHSLYAHLSLTTFAAAHPHLDDAAAAAWLADHPDARLDPAVLDALLDRQASDVEDGVAGLTHLPAAVVDRLTGTTRAPAARRLAGRDDLTTEQLARLLTRDDAQASAAVWDNVACTDQLRRAILSGTTMNPRARTPDRLVETPSVTVPARLQDAARASADPSVVAHGWTLAGASDAELVARLTAVADAVRRHMADRSPYRRHRLTRTLAKAAADTAGRCTSAQLSDVASRLRVTASTRLFRWSDVEPVLAELADVAVSSEPRPEATLTEALRDALTSGRLHAADCGDLPDLDDVDLDSIHDRAVATLLDHRPDLLDLDWVARRVQAGTLPNHAHIGAGLVVALADRGVPVPMQLIASAAYDALDVGVVARHAVPAVTVLAKARGRLQVRLAGLVEASLGTDQARWATFVELLDGYEGSLAALLEVVADLTGASVEQVAVVAGELPAAS